MAYGLTPQNLRFVVIPALFVHRISFFFRFFVPIIARWDGKYKMKIEFLHDK